MTTENPCKKPGNEYIKEVELALHTINRLFGKNTWHEHQKISGFLEGYLAGFKFAESDRESREYDE
jgi:hypothetical protein